MASNNRISAITCFAIASLLLNGIKVQHEVIFEDESLDKYVEDCLRRELLLNPLALEFKFVEVAPPMEPYPIPEIVPAAEISIVQFGNHLLTATYQQRREPNPPSRTRETTGVFRNLCKPSCSQASAADEIREMNTSSSDSNSEKQSKHSRLDTPSVNCAPAEKSACGIEMECVDATDPADLIIEPDFYVDEMVEAKNDGGDEELIAADEILSTTHTTTNNTDEQHAIFNCNWVSLAEDEMDNPPLPLQAEEVNEDVLINAEVYAALADKEYTKQLDDLIR